VLFVITLANCIFLGAFLDLVRIVATIGTAVVLFPILKRRSEILALGFVTARRAQLLWFTTSTLWPSGSSTKAP
jgi:phosphate/sulfate permease